MPPKRKAPAKQESPPPSESEPEFEPEDFMEEEPEAPKSKKAKATGKAKAPAKTKAAALVGLSPQKAKLAAKPAPKEKRETTKKVAEVEVAAEKSAPASTAEKKSINKAVAKQVIIEYCKQCQSFKRAAMKLEGLLKKAVPNLDVTLNPEKPRKGTFEVRDVEGNVFLSLQDLVRPFKKMKDLNLEEMAEEVASKLS